MACAINDGMRLCSIYLGQNVVRCVERDEDTHTHIQKAHSHAALGKRQGSFRSVFALELQLYLFSRSDWQRWWFLRIGAVRVVVVFVLCVVQKFFATGSEMLTTKRLLYFNLSVINVLLSTSLLEFSSDRASARVREKRKIFLNSISFRWVLFGSESLRWASSL